MPPKNYPSKIYIDGVEISSQIPSLEPGTFAEDAKPAILANDDAEIVLEIKMSWWQKRRLKRTLKKLTKPFKKLSKSVIKANKSISDLNEAFKTWQV